MVLGLGIIGIRVCSLYGLGGLGLMGKGLGHLVGTKQWLLCHLLRLPCPRFSLHSSHVGIIPTHRGGGGGGVVVVGEPMKFTKTKLLSNGFRHKP